MTDIDFDELDKAVTSLMGNVGKERTDDGPQEKTFTVSSTLKPGEKPEYQKLGEVAKTIGNETLIGKGELTIVEKLDPKDKPDGETAAKPVPVVQPHESSLPKPIVPAVKRPSSGRFMDVVHPLSNMKTADPNRLEVPARESSSPIVPTDTPVTPVVPQPTSVAVEAAPLTPFLPDAKVEKRPLGDPMAVPKPESEPAGVPQAAPAPESAPVEVPEQEKKDESFDNQKLINASEVTPRQTEQEKQLQVIEATNVEPAQEPTIGIVESGDTEHLTKNGTLSEPTAAEEPAGDIYSVKGDHQALGHPAKQKSGWKVVVAIVLIIILFIALGAAAYFILGGSFLG